MENTAQVASEATAKITEPIRVRYCLYARKSTEQEDKQVLSIDSQIKEMEKMATNDGLEIVMMKKESHSAKEAGIK
jgi:DNA invertase Pin-like site-specific DNA recombinase